MAELVGSYIQIHALRCLSDPKFLFYLSALSLCLSVDHCRLVPVDDMVLFQGKGEQSNSQVSHHRPLSDIDLLNIKEATYGRPYSLPRQLMSITSINVNNFHGSLTRLQL